MLNNNKGITLTEIVVVIGILGLISEAVFLFISQGYKSWQMTRDQAEAQDNARMALEKIVEEIREIQPSDQGAASIEAAGDTSFIFYSNVDNDSDVEKVKYYLDGSDFKRNVIEPVGKQYTGNGITYLRARYVRNNDIFSFYDETNKVIAKDVNGNIPIDKISEVHIKIMVDYNPNQVPNAIILETDANLRNKRLNL